MKTVLITGANQGIGFETARQLEALGYYVFIGARDPVKGQQALELLKQAGASNIDLIVVDISSASSIQRAKAQLESKLTVPVLDILINNAAILGDPSQQIDKVAIAHIKEVFDTNFFGTIQNTQAFLPLLNKSDLPVIVNVSSELGSLTTHSVNFDPKRIIYDLYSASKAALNAFTILLSNQFKNSNFKINSVTPGYTATNLNNYMGKNTPQQGAAVIVKYATIGPDGPTGGFFNAAGTVSW